MELPGQPQSVQGWRDNLAKPAPPCAPAKAEGVSPPASPTGRIFGDYELIEEISRGSMGVVWKARQLGLNRVVALKAISSGVLATSEDVARFRTEAEMLARVKHPNVISIHEVSEFQGVHFFSMDYVEGRSLEAIVQQQPLSPREAASLMRTVAEAVHFLHLHGVMHRDIKPLNIVLDPWGRPVLLDFGLAKQFGDPRRLTQTGVVMGSPCYMAPEQAERGEHLVGPHTEVHALGVTLYQLLTAAVPYTGNTVEETLTNVAHWRPKPPSAHVPSIPHDLETIVLKCLEKSPAHRYATAGELAEDLDRFLAGAPVLARRAKLGRRTLTWFEQHPWTIVWTGLALCSVLFGTAFGLWEQTRYLAAKLAVPGGTLLPPLTGWLRVTGLEFFTLLGAMMACALLIRSSAYGISVVTSILRPDLMTAQYRRPVPAWLMKLSVMIALLSGAEGLRSFMGFIERGVWTQRWSWEQLALETYALAIWSVGLTGLVWRYYRAQHRGTPLPHEGSMLPHACRAAVQEAIAAGHESRAVRLCRESANMDPAAAERCVSLLMQRHRESAKKTAGDERRGIPAVSGYMSAIVGVCAFAPVIAYVFADDLWKHATLAVLLGVFLGIALTDVETRLRKVLHRAALFLTCGVLVARAVQIKAQLGLPESVYLWLVGGICAGAGIVAASVRDKRGLVTASPA